MAQVIVIGANGETRPYAAAGLQCFEPGRGRLIERVLAERVRCEVLAMTRAAFNALPTAVFTTWLISKSGLSISPLTGSLR